LELPPVVLRVILEAIRLEVAEVTGAVMYMSLAVTVVRVDTARLVLVGVKAHRMMLILVVEQVVPQVVQLTG
jgi:hypothetical protein